MHFELLISKNQSKRFLYIKKFYYSLNRGRKLNIIYYNTNYSITNRRRVIGEKNQSWIDFLNSIFIKKLLRNDENVLYCNCYYPYVSSPIFLLSCFVNSFLLSMWRMFLKWNVIEMFVFLVSLHYMRTCTKVTFSNNPLLSKSMDWFLYDNVLRHKSVKVKLTWHHFSNF